MVGRELASLDHGKAGTKGPVLLEVRNLSDPKRLPGANMLLQQIHLKACAGEIVGLAGLAGAGRTELALTLFGARPRGDGEVLLRGQPFRPRSPAEAIAAGVGYLSEDRKESGLFLDMTISRNVAAGRGILPASEAGGIARGVDTKHRRGLPSAARIASYGPDQEVGRLSGGNQQKVLFARWLLANPSVLIVDEPTRGVDVGAKVELHELLREFAKRGSAVIVISSDLPEVLALSDRAFMSCGPAASRGNFSARKPLRKLSSASPV